MQYGPQWLTCQWCGDEFQAPENLRPDQPLPKYCKTSHRQRAFEARLNMPLTNSLIRVKRRWEAMRNQAGNENARSTFTFCIDDLDKVIVGHELSVLSSDY